MKIPSWIWILYGNNTTRFCPLSATQKMKMRVKKTTIIVAIAEIYSQRI